MMTVVIGGAASGKSEYAEGLALAGIDFAPTAKNGPFKAFLDRVDFRHDAVTHVHLRG